MKISTNLNAIQNEFQKINKSAYNIAKRDLEKLPEDFVNMMVSQRDVEANLKVIKTYDELLGSIIDIYA